MPIYEYRCRDCATDFEEFIRGRVNERTIACPKCSSKNIEKLFSMFGFSSGSSSQSSTGTGSSCSGCASKNCATCH